MMQLVLCNFLCGAWVHDKIDPQQSDCYSMCRRPLRIEPGSNFSEEEVPIRYCGLERIARIRRELEGNWGYSGSSHSKRSRRY